MTNTVEDAADFRVWKEFVLARLHTIRHDTEVYIAEVENCTVEDWLTQELPVPPDSIMEVI